MSYHFYNNNPSGKIINDETVRAYSLVTGENWQKSYIALAMQGFILGDMPTSMSVLGSLLKQHGFRRHVVSNVHGDAYTLNEFLGEHDKGVFVLIFDNHCVACIDGVYYDAHEVGNEIPQYYWVREA